MQIAILGYGSQGQAAYQYWNAPDNHITICDRNRSIDLPDGVGVQLGDNSLASLGHFDLIIRSPSVHPADIVAANSPAIMRKVTTVTNEFMRVCPTKNIIGVTGTKGKGTTATLITKMLEAAGERVHLGGNIGTPPLELLKNNIKKDDWVVLELANFQLIDLKTSPPVAVCLMVTNEHLNWHKNMDEYVTSKQQMFRWQEPGDIAIYYAANDLSKKIASVSNGKKIPYMQEPGAYVKNGVITIDDQPICKTAELKLLGKHNWQNACAAATAVWQIKKDAGAIAGVLKSFGGLEHRLELVRELNGVRYYDDSFGTTPETAIVAIQAFDQPKVVILGGSDKGADYDELAKVIKQNDVRHAVVIGETGPAIEQALKAIGFDQVTKGGENIQQIVAIAARLAQPGDVVLLSTGSASFGMFKDYKERGEQFKKTVLALS